MESLGWIARRSKEGDDVRNEQKDADAGSVRQARRLNERAARACVGGGHDLQPVRRCIHASTLESTD